MDIVRILDDSIRRLPVGDHSLGLAAIMRHISSAIRHFERDDEEDPDSCTDAIYRTNQAYEGSLKEAYRVLAKKSPNGLTLSDIEKYLESNAVLRPRVLTQLSRYRQDYRNPSAHDYKLDFDKGEALLAVLAVCAFAKVLTDQISERLAFDAATKSSTVSAANITDSNFFEHVLKIALEFTQESEFSASYPEFEGGLAGALKASGIYSAKTEVEIDSDIWWDILIENNDLKMAIEVRNTSKSASRSTAYALTYLIQNIEEGKVDAGLAVLRTNTKAKYKIYVSDNYIKPIYLVTRFNSDQLKITGSGLETFVELALS